MIGIFGGSGFIGKSLTPVFKKKKIKFKIIKHGEVDLDGIDTIVNLVGRFEPPFEEQLKTNVLFLNNLCENAVAAGVKKIIHISASAIYNSEGETNPDNTYGLTKLLGDDVLKYYSNKNNISVIILRPPNVYGPGSDHGVVYQFYKSIKETGGVTIYGDGKQERDFLYISDLLDVIIKSLNHKTEFEIFNVGSGKVYTLLDLVKCFEGSLDRTIKINFKDAQVQSNKIVFSDISRTKKILRWSPKTDLIQGIDNLVQLQGK